MAFNYNFKDVSLARHRRTATLLTSSFLLGLNPAFAQQAPTVAPAADEALQIGEIVVTATKRSEKLQSVPISIQAFSGEKLSQNQVVSFDDYAKLLPSVSFQSFGPSQTQLSFRAISSGGDGLHGGSLPTAGLYLDEIPVTTVAGAVDLHVYDIQRVEALSGPQGTLYGASSLAGTLRLITNKPKQGKFEAGYDLGLNEFGKGEGGGLFEGYVNVPLAQNVAIRLVGFYERDGGYIDNVRRQRTYTLGDSDPTTNVTIDNRALVKDNINAIDTWGGRAALGINLDDNWTVTPTVAYQNQITNGPFLFDPRVGDLKVTDFLPTRNRDEFYQAGLTVEGKIGNWNLTYIGGYFERTVSNVSDYSYYTVAYDSIPGYTQFVDGNGNFIDPTQQVRTHDAYSKLTQEVRVTSPVSNPLRLTAGLFFQRQTDAISADYVVNGLSTAVNASVVPGTVDRIFITRINRVDRDYAAYGELSYDILSNLTLTAGIRGFLVRNTLYGFSGFASNVTQTDPTDPNGIRPLCLPTTFNDAPCINVHDANGRPGPRGANQGGETHRVNLSYKIDPDKLVYFTYSTGFRPGGVNRRPGVNPYVPDTINNYEIGAKTSFFNRAVRFNIALYYEEWKNLQFGLSPIGSAGVVNIYNAGDARVYGLEGDASWRVTHGLTLSAAGSYNDAKTTRDFFNFDANGNPVNDPTIPPLVPKGTRLPVQPHYKINATARYEFPVGNTNAFLQGSLNTQDGTRVFLPNYSPVGSPPIQPDTRGFTTADFSGGFKYGNMSFELYIQNAFDGRGILSLNTVCTPTICGPFARSYPIKPQLYGIKFGQKF